MQTSDAPKRSFALLAWIVILLMCGIQASLVVIRTLGDSTTVSSEDDPVNGLVVNINEELTGKVIMGLGDFMPDTRPVFLSQSEPLKEGIWRERFAYVILVGEIEGAEAALALIVEEKILDETDDVDGDVESLIETIRLLQSDRVEEHNDLPSLNAERREELKKRAGWMGRLALLHPDTVDQAGRREMIDALLVIPLVIGIVGLILGGLGLAGFFGLIVFIVRAFKGRVRHGFRIYGSRGGLYAETFACWCLLFIGSSLVLEFAVDMEGLPDSVETGIGLAIFFLSLLALAWPVFRGVSWKQVRQDIGWTTNRGVFREVLGGGLAGYAMLLPILGVAVVLVSLLLMLQQIFFPDAPLPSHPVQGMAASGDPLIIVEMYILACIAAPLVEETIFRGVLYRHLREASGKWSLVVSVLLSALGSSLIFAALHPQGLVAIPTLVALGSGFCFIREWRGSLLPSMFAHGFHNFLAITMITVLFGSG